MQTQQTQQTQYLAFTEFQDDVRDFLDEYSDDQCYGTVAQKIVTLLQEGRHLPFDNPNNALCRFNGEGAESSIRELAHAVMSLVKERDERSIVRSFFHSSGSQRLALNELMDSFWYYADRCMGLVEDDDDSDEEDAE